MDFLILGQQALLFLTSYIELELTYVIFHEHRFPKYRIRVGMA